VSRFTFQDMLDATGAVAVHGDGRRVLRGVSTDTRTVMAEQLYLALSGPNFDGNRFAAEALGRGAGALLLRRDGAGSQDLSELDGPAVDGALALVDDPRRALADLARWYRGRLEAHVIGITGSCGKTTTKNMLVGLLSDQLRTVGSPASFNNDVGVPHSLLLADEDTEALVLEIGTNAPGEIEALCAIARPTCGLITGVGASHLAGLGSVEGVAREKAALARAVPAEGFVVLGQDCRFTPLIREQMIREEASARVITFSLDGDGDLDAREVSFHAGGTSFQLGGPLGTKNGAPRRIELPLLGHHMVRNLLAALAVCHGLGLELDGVLPAVANLEDGSRRMERRELEGQLVLDDSYNANPESARASLRVLAGLRGHARRVLVLGDMHELGERSEELHRALGEDVAAAGLDLFITVGPRARAAAEGALSGGQHAARVVALPDLDAALGEVPRLLSEGDVVLVKGSRAAGLEGLVTRLEEARPRAHEHTPSG
jgi:UDP-N-acetylmuramoyl-tripeptide--D-alanyl-D-alanine ligase